MTLSEEIVAVLRGGSPTLCGGRIYPGILPERPVMPAIAYTIIFDENEEGLAGEDCGLENAHVQVDCYAKTHLEARATVDAARLLLLASDVFQARTVGGFDTVEEDVQLYRATKEFSIWLST